MAQTVDSRMCWVSGLADSQGDLHWLGDSLLRQQPLSTNCQQNQQSHQLEERNETKFIKWMHMCWSRREGNNHKNSQPWETRYIAHTPLVAQDWKILSATLQSSEQLVRFHIHIKYILVTCHIFNNAINPIFSIHLTRQNPSQIKYHSPFFFSAAGI